MRSAVTRAVKAFRFAPRSFIHALRSPVRLTNGDASDIEQFSAAFEPAPTPDAGVPHLLILSYLPLHYTSKLETLLARAMQERGWKTSVLATQSTEWLAREYCAPLLGAKIFRVEDFLDFRNEREVSAFVDEALAVARTSITEFKQLTYRGAPLGLSATASFTASRPDGIIAAEQGTYRLLGKLLRQSALLLHAAESLYHETQPSLALCQEKGFVGTCETFYAALRLGIDYVQWTSCHEPDAIMFKRYRKENTRDHPFSISEPTWARLRQTPWEERFRDAVLGEFDRGYRSGNWFKYKKLSSDHTFAERDVLVRQLGLDPLKKTAVIYSHILNDANLFYGTDLFAGGYEQWLVETVRAAASNPAVNWVLKLHPANVFRNARLGYSGEFGELLALQRAFGEVPAFLRIVRPDEKMSPFSFFGITDWGVTVRGTVGVELPCFGIPVLTAGTGRYAGKGFTVDSATTEEYLQRVRTIHHINPLDEEQVKLGILHAYFVFRGRPARFGDIFNDIYPKPLVHPRHRDIKLRFGCVSDVIAHPQMKAITDFLVSSEDDFLDPRILAGLP